MVCAQVWDDFQDRFGIPEIVEFYGATEGNGALINYCTERGARGAVGRLGYFLRKLSGIKIVQFDVTEEVPVRDQVTGYCIECEFDEPGEMLIPISEGAPFEGYTDSSANAKKIARGVFVPGDVYFRTGDLLSRDAEGFIILLIASATHSDGRARTAQQLS